ncbi:MAG: cytochrome c1 [Pseudomonadota bacterium]
MKTILSSAIAALLLSGASLAQTAEEATGAVHYLSTEEAQAKYFKHPEHIDWPQAGVMGAYDKAQLQRGLQVYKEVCSACHGLKFVAFRNLEDLGYSSAQVKAFAGEYTFIDGPDDQGEMYERPGKPSDYFPSPFANSQAAAAANNGAAPPDLSLVVKAREGGENYVYSLLSGYADAPDDVELGDGQSYNPYFASLVLAMGPPLFDGAVNYADGTEASVDQMARDVAAFLTWAAEPNHDQRKEMGLMVMLFLGVLTVLTYASYRRVWAKVKSDKA